MTIGRTLKNLLIAALLFLLFLMALMIRLHDLGLQSLWYDEMCSIFYAGSNYWKTTLFWDNNPILYHALLGLWLRIKYLQVADFEARLLSAIFSSLSVLGIYFWGASSGSRKRGLLLAFLLCCSTLSITYAQEARMYALFELMTILFLCSAWRLSIKKSQASWTLFFLSAFLLVNTHILGIVAASFGPLYLWRVKTISPRRLIQLLFLIFVPALLTLCLQFRVGAIQWQQDQFSALALWKSLRHFFSYFNQNHIGIGILSLFLAILASLSHPTHRGLARLIFAYIFFLILAALLFALFDRRLVFFAHYFIFLNPLWLMLILLGLECVPLLFALFFCAGFGAFFLGGYENRKPDWRSAAAMVVANHADLVMTTKSIALSMPYFYDENYVPVEPFTIDANAANSISEKVKKYKNVWLVDDSRVLESYIPALEKQLNSMQIKTEVHQFENHAYVSIYAIRLRKTERPVNEK